MPPLLHYLALIESGYQSHAVSPVGATGLWQIMPETARTYGLTVTEAQDDRYDPLEATRAAARYLRDLAFDFGGDSLFLAVAAYNAGETKVRRALRQLDDPFSDRNYWELAARELLPRETVIKIPLLLAATVAGEAGLPDVGALQAAGY
jgi:membrane-bound lytic murein transglycosylase D